MLFTSLHRISHALLMLLLLSSALFLLRIVLLFLQPNITCSFLLDISGRDRTSALPAFRQVFLINFSLKNHLTTKENARQCTMGRARDRRMEKRQTTKTDYQISCLVFGMLCQKRLQFACTMPKRHMLSLLQIARIYIHETSVRKSKKERESEKFGGRAFVRSATFDSNAWWNELAQMRNKIEI